MEANQHVLLKHLPGIYQSSPELVDLLSVFEEILFGREKAFKEQVLSDKVPSDTFGLVQLIEAMPNLANPYFKGIGLVSADEGKEFLYWLSGWLAISQPHLFDTEQLRKLVANAVPLYSMRGTKDYLLTMLSYLGIERSHVDIDDQGLPVFTIGQSALGEDTRLGDLPFLFRVRVTKNLAEWSASEVRAFKNRVRSVIELAKPAHTLFELKLIDEERWTREKIVPNRKSVNSLNLETSS